MIQARSNPPVDPVLRPISAETMKMPEPIMEPTTMVVESNRPKPRTNPEESASTGSAVAIVVFVSGIGLLLPYFSGSPRFQPVVVARLFRGEVFRPARIPGT